MGALEDTTAQDSIQSYLTTYRPMAKRSGEAEEIAVTTSGGRKAAIDWHGVQLRAAEHARHRNLSSLDSYVRSIRKERMRAPEQEDYVTMRQALAAARQELEITQAKARGLDARIQLLRKES